MLCIPDISDEILLQTESILNKRVHKVEQVTKGMTNLNFKIFTSDGTYIYRVPDAASNILIDRTIEKRLLSQVGEIDIDVDTVFFEIPSGRKITSYVDDRLEAITSNRIRMNVGCSLLKKLHKSGLEFENTFNVLERIGYYESIMIENRIPFFDGYAQTRKKAEVLYNYLHSISDGRLLPCHNDLVPENMLLDKEGNHYLIDWEYGGMNDYLWDLASFSLEHNFDTGSESRFLLIYFGEAADLITVRKLNIYKILQDLLWSLWSLIKCQFGVDFFLYGNNRFKRAMRNMDRIGMISASQLYFGNDYQTYLL